MSGLDYVGKRILRKDGPIKVTGQAQYTVDIQPSGLLTGRILRSPHPHARILNIDTSRALKLAGVRAVITAKDTPGIKHGFVETPRYPADQWPLAVERVRYVGEEIAAVAAVDSHVAAEALSLIRVDYEPLPVVFDPETAMRPDAPGIHPRHPKGTDPFSNIAGKTESGWGDLEEGFARSDYIREDCFQSHLRTHGYLEPQVTVADFGSGGKLNVWTSSQGPFIKRTKLAQTLGLAQSAVRIHQAYVGGAFGGKIDLFSHEFCAALLSLKSGRPVKIEASRAEILSAYRHGQPLIVELKTGVKKDGTLTAVESRIYLDGGAYTSYGVITAYYAGSMIPTLYTIPNYRYEGFRVMTNKPACGAMRGHGAPQPRFAFESLLSMIADDLGIDPVEIRLRNAVGPNTRTCNELNIQSCEFKQTLKEVTKKSGWKQKYGKLPPGKGIGIGCGGFVSGAGYSKYRGQVQLSSEKELEAFVKKAKFPHSNAIVKISKY